MSEHYHSIYNGLLLQYTCILIHVSVQKLFLSPNVLYTCTNVL